jgi:zinc protease
MTFAQNMPQNTIGGKLKLDPKIRTGKLENGMTYYIRHNETPKAHAEFYFVQKTGSMQEENMERGMAHLLEHLAMKGSKNFPGNRGIQHYIESIGMRVGENLSTSTGFDETIYKLLNVPVTRQGTIDSSLLILHDWSAFLLLEEETIQQAIKNLRENWRTYKNVQMRILEQQIKDLYPDSKYGSRLPIGILGSIENFSQQDIINFYKTWYRPDLQAILIIGDIDVDQIESKVKKIFADIPVPVDPKKKDNYLVQENELPITSIVKDEEMPYTTLRIFYKFNSMPEILTGTEAHFIDNYTKNIISLVMNERLVEIKQRKDPPFGEAQINIGDYLIAKTKKAWTMTAIVKPDEIEKALQTLVRETIKIKKFGITKDEYERAKTNLLSMYEKVYKERNNTLNRTYAEQCIDHFIKGDYIPGIEVEYKLINQYISDKPIEVINSFIRYMLKDADNPQKLSNIVISIIGTEKGNIIYPKPKDIAEFFLATQRVAVEEEEEEVISKEIIPTLPQPGKILAESKDKIFGTTNFKLSNGATVVIKQTNYKANEILMKAMSPGGTSLFKDEKDIWNIKWLNTAIQLGGLGQFSNIRLGKTLSGKVLSCEPGITSSDEHLNGSTIPRDLKTLFEIIYLYFTDMRSDINEFKEVKEKEIWKIKNESTNPDIIFSNTFKALLYNDNPRNMRLKETDFEKINYDRMIEMYNERFADASDFVFTFVGNIDLDTIKPLIEQYIASLPTIDRKDIPDEKQETPFQKGVIKKKFTQKLERPYTTFELKYSGTMPYNQKNIIIAQVLTEIIDKSLQQKLREDKMYIYNALSSVDLYDFPLGKTSIDIFFVMNPDIYEKVIKSVREEVQNLANKGPATDHLSSSKRGIKQQMEEIRKQNAYWLDIISGYYFNQLDGHTKYNEILDSLTIEDIRKFTKELISQGNEIELVMLPE